MFQRRLALLVLVSAGVVAVLGLQLARLTVVQGAQRRIEAEKPLTDRAYVPTRRGRILDRHGRVLAEDRPTYDVTVKFSVITGRWAYDQAAIAARRANREQWGEMSGTDREAMIAEYRKPFDQQLQDLWNTLSRETGTPVQEINDRKSTISSRVQRIASHVWKANMDRLSRESDEQVTLTDAAFTIRDQVQEHEVIRNISDEARLKIQQIIAMANVMDNERDADGNLVINKLAVWQNVGVDPARTRAYPLDAMEVDVDLSKLPGPLKGEGVKTIKVEGVASHIIGFTRPIGAEQINERPFVWNDHGDRKADLGGYIDGDLYGVYGIEQAQERRLRGIRGQELRHLDTGHSEHVAPEPGKDVVLTIDVALQARIAAAMDPSVGLMVAQPWHDREKNQALGTPLNGAAVVIDVSQGHVLAAVSMPTMRRRSTEADEPEQPEPAADDIEARFYDEINFPWMNRVVAQPYQPGSTMKPLVYLAAATQGKSGLHRVIECNGHLHPDQPTVMRCWIWNYFLQTHGPLRPEEAICRSCNIYFFTLGREMGTKDLVTWMQRFGAGRKPGTGLPEEINGFVPDLALADVPNQPGFQRNDATFMGIGQGPIALTPIQIANAYATIARGGYMLSPSFVQIGEPSADMISEDLHLNPEAVDVTMKGMWLSANDIYGTSHHINYDDLHRRVPTITFEGATVYAKSGTADASPLMIDTDGDGKKETKVRDGDHSWYVAMIKKPGSSRVNYIVTVVVEYGGSGNAVSGPIVDQILHAMRAEGYL